MTQEELREDIRGDCEASQESLREDVWAAASDAGFVATTTTKDTPLKGSIHFITCLLYFLCFWQCLNCISENAMEKLLSILSTIFKKFRYHEAFAASVAVLFPTSMFAVRTWINIAKMQFSRFVVCPECTCLYEIDSLLYKDRSGNVQAKKCQNILFKRGKFAKACNSKLMKRIVLTDGNIQHYPLKIYCYKSITESLDSILSREGNVDQCNLLY